LRGGVKKDSILSKETIFEIKNSFGKSQQQASNEGGILATGHTGSRAVMGNEQGRKLRG